MANPVYLFFTAEMPHQEDPLQIKDSMLAEYKIREGRDLWQRAPGVNSEKLSLARTQSLCSPTDYIPVYIYDTYIQP